MARTKFDPRGKNAETLVIEYIRVNHARRIKLSTLGEVCSFYWDTHHPGVFKARDTYSRAFRRVREAGLIDVSAPDANGFVRINRSPRQTVVSSRHDMRMDGERYGQQS